VIVTINQDENIIEKTRATEMVKIAVKVVEDHVTDQVVVIENITQVAITSKLFVKMLKSNLGATTPRTQNVTESTTEVIADVAILGIESTNERKKLLIFIPISRKSRKLKLLLTLMNMETNFFGMGFNGLVKFKDLVMVHFSIHYNQLLIKRFRKFLEQPKKKI